MTGCHIAVNLPIAIQRFPENIFFRARSICQAVHRADSKSSVFMLYKLMYNDGASPVPAGVILSVILAGIKMPFVFASGRIPAVDITVGAVTDRFSCIECSSVEGVDFRANPWSGRAFAHPVIGAEAIAVVGIYQIVPFTHLEEICTFVCGRICSGRIQRFTVFPSGKIIGDAQRDTSIAFGCAVFPCCQQHPPFFFFRIPEDKRISPVRHPIYDAVRAKCIFRDIVPLNQIPAYGVSCPLRRRFLVEGAVKHMIDTAGLDDRAGAAVNIGWRLSKRTVIFGGDSMPSEFVLLIGGTRVP